MKKIIALVFVAAFLASTVVGCGSATTSKATTVPTTSTAAATMPK